MPTRGVLSAGAPWAVTAPDAASTSSGAGVREHRRYGRYRRYRRYGRSPPLVPRAECPRPLRRARALRSPGSRGMAREPLFHAPRPPPFCHACCLQPGPMSPLRRRISPMAGKTSARWRPLMPQLLQGHFCLGIEYEHREFSETRNSWSHPISEASWPFRS